MVLVVVSSSIRGFRSSCCSCSGGSSVAVAKVLVMVVVAGSRWL